MGWPVFPLNGKQPLVSHGHREATTDEAQIREWLARWPNANIGVPTGLLFWVLDMDPRHNGDESLRALIYKYGALPRTLQQMTGGGGRHYLFALPDQMEIRSITGLLPGLDVKGIGGYIVVAPSIHPDTRQPYLWDGLEPPEKQPILPAPAWLLDLIRTHHQAKASEPVEVPPQIKHGVQHYTLFRLGCSMRRNGLEKDEIFSALWQANLNRCEKPGPEENIRELAEDICRRYPAGHINSNSTVSIPKALPAPVEPETEPPEPKAPRPVKPVKKSLREEALVLYNADYPAPKPIVDPILYPGLTILGGRPKVGKSWFALQLALAVVSGQKLAGYLDIKKPGRCLYVSLEDRPRQIRARLHRLTQPHDFLADLHFIYELPPLFSGGAITLDTELQEHPVEVLIVDSLFAAVQQAKRQNVDVMQADYNIVNLFRQLAEKYSIALVLIAHTRKAAGDFLDLIQGTTGTTAATDAVWVLQRTPEANYILSVTGRDFDNNTFGLKRTEASPAWIITGEGDEIAQSEARREILDLLREGPLKPSTIAQRLRKNISGIHRLLSALCALNQVVRSSYGTYDIAPPGSAKK
jgi:hypothetical protein